MGMIQCTEVFGGILDTLYYMYVASTCYSMCIMSTLHVATHACIGAPRTGIEVSIYFVLAI